MGRSYRCLHTCGTKDRTFESSVQADEPVFITNDHLFFFSRDSQPAQAAATGPGCGSGCPVPRLHGTDRQWLLRLRLRGRLPALDLYTHARTHTHSEDLSRNCSFHLLNQYILVCWGAAPQRDLTTVTGSRFWADFSDYNTCKCAQTLTSAPPFPLQTWNYSSILAGLA